jgi:hypothetical protein
MCRFGIWEEIWKQQVPSWWRLEIGSFPPFSENFLLVFFHINFRFLFYFLFSLFYLVLILKCFIFKIILHGFLEETLETFVILFFFFAKIISELSYYCL